MSSEIPYSVTQKCESRLCAGGERTFNRQFVIKDGPDPVYIDHNRPIGPSPGPREWTFKPSGPRQGAPLSMGACVRCGSIASIPPTIEELQEMFDVEEALFEERRQKAISDENSRRMGSSESLFDDAFKRK